MEPSSDSFYHPYRPYDIQLEFMRSLYQCLEERKIGIFESPTGTGKSLSLICGALTWLRDHERRSFDQLESDGIDQLDWLAQAERSSRIKTYLGERDELEKRLKSVRERKALKQIDGRPLKKVKTDVVSREEDFVLDDYESQDEGHSNLKDQTLSSSTQNLLAKLAPRREQQQEDDETEHRMKIIFCSRTHSQLTQVVSELQKVAFPSSSPTESSTDPNEQVKHLPLGSRKNLCINPKVNKLPSTTAINERCLELQKPGLTKEQKCEFLLSRLNAEDETRIESFKGKAIADIHDIEDIGRLGQTRKICPYYASRSAIPFVEVLTLPYPLLLQKSAREALGVKLKDNVVIIDEAHNLMDAIADTVSVTLPLSHLELAKKQVTGYCQKFKNKLKGKNRVYLAQLIRLLSSCIQFVQSQSIPKIAGTAVASSKLFTGTGLDQIQPHKILQYLQDSRLVYKVEGYADLVNQSAETGLTSTGTRLAKQPKGVLAEFQSLLVAHMNPTAEGRFFIYQENNDLILKYTLLDPREHFRQIVEEARSVILAGGTMSPMSHYGEHLFSYLDSDRLKTFSFGHVIEQSNLLVEAIVHGPSGRVFDFTFASRQSEDMISDLGQVLLEVCQKAPDGCVAFFPSYDYLAFTVALWNKSSLMDRISGVKQIFTETRGVATDEFLREYTETIKSGKGALMLAVVGGKLSEGINFSDALGRVVICVGLPYPNIQSAEWKAKIEYLETSQFEKLKTDRTEVGEARRIARTSGREYTDNTTMRAVNQSIGRAIRHQHDYATILLIDQRYATPRIQSKLPGWMKSNCSPTSKNWRTVLNNVEGFFVAKQNR